MKPGASAHSKANGVSGSAVHSLALVADSFHMVGHPTPILMSILPMELFTNYEVLQLNDVLSLCVGLWAVKVAHQRASSKMYTYGVWSH